MRVQPEIRGAVEPLNEYIQPNYVHTFQFVSVDEGRLNQLIWRTLSFATPKYRSATVSFTGHDAQTKTIQRTLVRNEYNQGPSWRRALGSGLRFSTSCPGT